MFLQGQLLHKLGNLDLAAFCVKHASELNSGLGQSPTQQAIVHSFLKNYDKVRFLYFLIMTVYIIVASYL
jgi:hypothetical protein